MKQTNTNIPMPAWQKDELDRRKQCFLENPDTTYTWEEIKKTCLKITQNLVRSRRSRLED